MKVYVTIGIPCSDKQFIANAISEKTGAIIIDTKSIRILRDLTGGCSSYDVYSTMYKFARGFLNNGKDIVLCASFSSKKIRKHIFRNLYNLDCEFIAVVKKVSLGIALNKSMEINIPREIVERHFRNFSIPKIKEGFNKIIIL